MLPSRSGSAETGGWEWGRILCDSLPPAHCIFFVKEASTQTGWYYFSDRADQK
jgi:hypothetical protein